MRKFAPILSLVAVLFLSPVLAQEPKRLAGNEDAFFFALSNLTLELIATKNNPKLNADQRKTAKELHEILVHFEQRRLEGKVDLEFSKAALVDGQPLTFGCLISKVEKKVFLPQLLVEPSFLRNYFTQRRLTNAYLLSTLAGIREMYREDFFPAQTMWVSFSRRATKNFFKYLALKQQIEPSEDPYLIDIVAAYAKGEESDAFLDLLTVMEGKDIRLEQRLEQIGLQNAKAAAPVKPIEAIRNAEKVIIAEMKSMEGREVEQTEFAAAVFGIRARGCLMRAAEVREQLRNENANTADLEKVANELSERFNKSLKDPNFEARFKAGRYRGFKKDPLEKTSEEYRRFGEWLDAQKNKI